ncbi:MAG: hypothetical protein IJA67_03970 [Oscillospiraceae bacterium]|nr:hypothetical protein [Oscillospiraceae bacterium]
MTNKKAIKRAILSSALALILCFTSLIGTTFAWFTDSVTSGRNIIRSGNLDMVVSYKPYGAENTKWKEVDENTKIFDDEALYEPGYTQAIWLKVENKGSLAFKYKMDIDVYEETPGVNQAGDEFYLSDSLVAAIQPFSSVEEIESFYDSREKLVTNFAWDEKALKDDELAFNNPSVLYPDGDWTEAYVCVLIRMPETVGNEANHNGTDIPQIILGLNAIATQVTYEEDSFGSDYDADADFVSYFTSGTHTINTTLKATTATDVITAEGADTVVNIAGGYYDAGSQDCAVWAKDGATVNIYDGTFIHDGNGTPADSAHHYDMIYAGANGGKINIYGGFYSARSEGVWLLNEKDNQGEINVYGGTFVNWNPADNISEGANTNFVADGYTVVEKKQANGDVWYYVVLDTSDLSDGGTLTLNHDITVADGMAPIHTNNSTGEITINGNGNTIKSTASSVDVFTWEGGTIPAMSTILSSANGSIVTVNDLTFSGTMSAVMLGHYQNATYNNYNTILNNVDIIDTEVVSFSANVSPALCVYGTAVLNNCEVSGTTLSPLDTDPMWPVYDVAAVNYSNTTLNNSKIGSFIMWNQAEVTVESGTEIETIVILGNMNTTKYGLTVKAGATVGAIDLSAITDVNRINIAIEDGANVGFVDSGVSYGTIEEWKNARTGA